MPLSSVAFTLIYAKVPICHCSGEYVILFIIGQVTSEDLRTVNLQLASDVLPEVSVALMEIIYSPGSKLEGRLSTPSAYSKAVSFRYASTVLISRLSEIT